MYINLFGIIYNCCVTVRYFLNNIVPVNIIIPDNLAILVIIWEISVADAKAREFNRISRFTGNGLMIGIVAGLDLVIVVRIHLIHLKGKYFILLIRRQIRSILVFKRLGNIHTRRFVCTVMPIVEIEMPFCFRVEILLCYNPAGTGTCTSRLADIRVRRKKNTSCRIQRQ